MAVEITPFGLKSGQDLKNRGGTPSPRISRSTPPGAVWNRFVTNIISLHYAYNMSMGNSKFNVSDASSLYIAYFLRAQNMVQVIEGKIIYKWSAGKQKLLRFSGRFELSRVRVTEGKITVNVWQKSRGNRFWFELARGLSYRESTVFI